MAKAKRTDSSEKMNLQVTKREVFGKKLKALRKSGVLPANVYGADFKSVALSVGFKDFIKTYRVVRETGIVYLSGLAEELPVLVSHVQKHPVNDSILHVDFRSVDLKKKIETEVPVVLIGESDAAKVKGGVVLQLTKVLKIEALPQNIPHEIQVDISVIKDLGQEIKVDALPASSTYEVKDDKTRVIVSVVAHKEESVTPEITAAAAPEVLTAKVDETAPTAEGAAPAVADKKAESSPAPKPEEKK